MITCVIFDLDGLLADTERLHRQAYQDVLRPYGAEPSDAEYMEYWIRTGRGIEHWIQEKGLSPELNMIRQQKNQRYAELVKSSAQPMNGALALLKRLSGKLRLALASASYRGSVFCVIEHLDMARYFEIISTRNDVARSKPAPDIFLYAAQKLEVEADQCVVLEDSERGVLAAHGAGMKSIAVPNKYTQHNDFSKATRVVSTLDEVTIELLSVL